MQMKFAPENSDKPTIHKKGYPTTCADWSYGVPVQPSSLKSQYDTLTLIRSDEDLAALDADDNTLIVCCDWLLSHQLVMAGRHAVYYEAGLVAWQKDDDLDTELFNHSNDWILDSEEADNTNFHSVCVGRTFSSEISMALINFYRIHRAIYMLVKTYRPKHVCFYDVQFEINHLERHLRSRIVARIAATHYAEFHDMSSDATDAKQSARVNNYRDQTLSLGYRSILAGIYIFATKTITWLRRKMMYDDNRALVLINTNILDPIILGYQNQRVTPVVLARSVPRSLKHLYRCFVSGVLMVDLSPTKLDEGDTEAITNIQAAILRAANGLNGPVSAFLKDYIVENIAREDVIRSALESICAAENLLNRIKPKSIVVDGVRSQRPTIFIELAAAKGICVNYMWHSPNSPQSLKLGALGGDARQPRFVDRCLSWGEINDTWLQRVGKDVEAVRIGSPMIEKFSSSVGKPQTLDKPVANTNVLLLQYTYTVPDLAGLNTAMHGSLVSTVLKLKELGYKNIRYKLHPGGGRFDLPHFQRIADYFDLDCELHRLTPFKECLEWADIVIGPTLSGAFIESLSTGIPYHAYLLPPQTTVKPDYYGDFPLINDIDELTSALQRDISAAARKLVNGVWDNQNISNPCTRFWNALSEPSNTGTQN